MDTCKNCGKPLENPDQELCPACRAVENAKARTRREEKAGHARRRRMNRTTRKMLIAVCVLAVVFTGLCVTATVMYDKYNPDEFIASVDAALEAGDARALKNLLKGEDLTVSDEAALPSGPRIPISWMSGSIPVPPMLPFWRSVRS